MDFVHGNCNPQQEYFKGWPKVGLGRLNPYPFLSSSHCHFVGAFHMIILVIKIGLQHSTIKVFRAGGVKFKI